jgi:rubrerythrin
MSHHPIDRPHEREKNSHRAFTVRHLAAGGNKMNEKIKEGDPRKTEVRCDVCRKTFAASEADKRCPECEIGRVRIMEKAA